MTKLQSWMMTGLAIAALGVGVLLASGAISSAQEGDETPTPSPSEEATNDGSPPTPSPSDDSEDADDAESEDEEDEDAEERRGCAGGGKYLVKEAAAEVLGLGEEEVRGALRDGQSLAELAEAQGMSVEDFSAALLSNIRADLQAQLDAGEITQEEFDEISAELSENLGDINSEGGFHHRFDDDEEDEDGDETGAGFVPPFQRTPIGSGT